MVVNKVEMHLFVCAILFAFGIIQDADAYRGENGHAYIEDFPSVVSLRIKNKHYSSGTLISNKHVLTAAHCAVMQGPWKDTYEYVYPPSVISVHMGSNSSRSNENAHAVQNVHVHELYTSSPLSYRSDDVAILTLKDPIKPSATQRPTNLPSKDAVYFENGYALGWGLAREPNEGEEWAELLQFIEGHVLDNKLFNIVDNAKMVVYTDNVTGGFCRGDSSGPYLSKNNEILGIISNGDNCVPNDYDIYTRVFHYLDWINTILEAEESQSARNL